VSFSTGTDGASGIGTRLLQRASAALTGTTTCGTYGSFATVASGTNPTSPLVDTAGRGSCYQYRYVASDNVGNQNTATSASVVKVATYLDTVAATSGLLSYWRLGESSGTTAADSKGTNTGTYAGGVTLGITGAIAGDTNKSASFDGVDDVVSVPDAASLKPATISVEAWVKPNAGVPTYASVLTKTTVNTWSDGYGMLAWNGGIDFWVNDDANDVVTAAVSTTSWSHVVGTYDGATIRIYLNGVLADSFAYAGPFVHSTSPLLIGNAAGTGNYHWPGGLDEVAVYNRALTATEVAQHYAAR
jgi:hypothetical protein